MPLLGRQPIFKLRHRLLFGHAGFGGGGHSGFSLLPKAAMPQANRADGKGRKPLSCFLPPTFPLAFTGPSSTGRNPPGAAAKRSLAHAYRHAISGSIKLLNAIPINHHDAAFKLVQIRIKSFAIRLPAISKGGERDADRNQPGGGEQSQFTRDSPYGVLGEAEIVAAGGSSQDGMSLRVADALRRVSAPGRDPNNGEFSVIETHLCRGLRCNA